MLILRFCCKKVFFIKIGLKNFVHQNQLSEPATNLTKSIQIKKVNKHYTNYVVKWLSYSPHNELYFIAIRSIITGERILKVVSFMVTVYIVSWILVPSFYLFSTFSLSAVPPNSHTVIILQSLPAHLTSPPFHRVLSHPPGLYILAYIDIPSTHLTFTTLSYRDVPPSHLSLSLS